ncbi:hypothetical protein SPRG_02749 [Saprolegnia parasitica CBS 223.65]|uniref:SRR1-like domain-containing protein n=1 Tax=Saprolegnia parasitica (strain CBS 223.65) TaxID=695850 RepID=A0A067CSQ8_SAPPC|nr:hypothetical protein SPRG_02749 [Saprolegnia parasitica CBS 223.65]KDO32270.1 hypothetical protein SPRG_02749 [Saprolegnia parasitica CBS 223.65]|eukprot:XP_012196726.1 hypothetical protein SPRG_02749 [Saprolegnia parasitica CBS 223.65]
MADEWTFVGRKQKKSFKPKTPAAPKAPAGPAFVYTEKTVAKASKVTGVDKAIDRARTIRDAMRTSSFFARICNVLVAHLPLETPLQLVAYGVGSFAHGPSGNAIYQLACASLLREFLATHEALAEAFIYDPIMTEDDNEVAAAMDLAVLETNEQGQRTAQTRTLFFMPHCGKQLYQNVLLSNWRSLEKVYVLGNSFAAYDDRLLVKAERAKSIFSALVPYTTEVALGPCDKKTVRDHVEYDAAFNDTSLHVFSDAQLRAATDDGLFTRDVDAFDVGTDEDLM